MTTINNLLIIKGIARNIKSIAKYSFNKNFQRCISTTVSNRQIRNDDTTLNIFDRYTKFLQRERAASAKDVNLYDYLKDEMGYRLADRVFDIKRKFKLAADIGTHQIFCIRYTLN